MDTQNLIGKLLDESAQRDAVHVAVFPCVAGMELMRGQYVELAPDGRAMLCAGRGIGITDPFWNHGSCINAGERFFIFLHPNTATSLRHVYSHPGLPEENISRAVIEAETWLQAYAQRLSVTYSDLLDAMEHGACFPSTDSPSEEIEPEAWIHFKALGRTPKKLVPGDGPYGFVWVETDEPPTYFRCAC